MLTASATAATSPTSAHSASPTFARNRLSAAVNTDRIVSKKFNIVLWFARRLGRCEI